MILRDCDTITSLTKLNIFYLDSSTCIFFELVWHKCLNIARWHCHKKNPIIVAVPDRNWILVHRVFRAHQWVQCATALSFCLGRGSYALCGRIRYSCIYIARMSPTLSGSLALQRVKLGDALEIRNGIIFNFYSELPQLYSKNIVAAQNKPLWIFSIG